MCEMERISGEEQILAARKEMAGWYMEAGRDAVLSHLSGLNWAPGAREGIADIRRAGVSVALASVTWSFAVEYVGQQLGIERFLSTELDFASGSIRHSWRSTKAEFLRSLAAEYGIRASNVAVVGDSSGDYDMLEEAGLGIFVGVDQPELADIIHMPDADIRDVSRTILSFEK